MPFSPDVIPERPNPRVCCNCAAPVGDKAKSDALHVDEGDPQSEHRTWCPACFVTHRAQMEPGRWKSTIAVQCLSDSCGWKSVSWTFDPREVTRCPRCGCSRTKVLTAAALVVQAIRVATAASRAV